ncbi:hypothetical protein [Elizabethkingia ursingii]
MMNKKLFTVSGIAIFAFLELTSCRSTDADEALKIGGIASVNIDLVGTDYSDTENSNPIASVKSDIFATGNEVQRYQEILTPSSYIEAELSPLFSRTSNLQASLGNNAIAAAGKNLGANIKYRIIAYRQSDGTYKDYKDYTISQKGTGLVLDRGVAYYLVVYSWGTNNLPSITSGELTNINKATITYNNTGRDFMYQKVSYVASNEKGSVKVTLRHKMTEITVSLNSVGGGSITSVGNAVIGPHYAAGTISLSTGNISRSGSSGNVGLSFPSGAAASKTSTAVILNADTGSSSSGIFSANVTLDGTTKTISLSNAFKVNPERQQKLTVNVKRCGAVINGIFRNFACQNLGATAGLDPFNAVAGNHGAKYQWGKKAAALIQADDQNALYYNGLQWNTSLAPDNSWNGGSEANPIKTVNDPCPSGYRVPTGAELSALYFSNINNIKLIGTWSNGATNYGSGTMIGDKLFLPSAGYRLDLNGSLQNRGNNGSYWSSTPYNGSYAYNLGLNGSRILPDSWFNRAGAFSVRCIAQ